MGFDSEECEDTQTRTIISSPTFRLLTTMNYTFFNPEDLQHEPESSSQTHHLLEQWERITNQLLDLQRRRLREAAGALGWTDVACRLSSPDVGLKDAIEGAGRESYACLGRPVVRRGFMRTMRVRILVNRNGEIEVDIPSGQGEDKSQLVPDLSIKIDNYTINPFTLSISASSPQSLVTIDTQPTLVTLFTQHKTTYRAPYTSARSRAQPPLEPTHLPTDREVLLFNSQHEIMEASLSSVYFNRGGTWITPSAENGGMQSVTKLYALCKGWCKEGIVRLDEIKAGEVVWLSNAVRGFFPGVLDNCAYHVTL